MTIDTRSPVLPRTTAPLFRSKKEAVLESLRSSIVNGALRPGERLVIDDLARRLGVSPIPIREALQLLQADGFVEIQPHVGATVTRIEPQLITEIFDLLEALERISGREACMRMSPEQFARMSEMLKAMDAMESDLEAWSDANAELHRLNDVFAHRVGNAQREHWEMFRAMKARNVARLEKVVYEHNRAARAAYTAHFKRALESETRSS